MLNLHPACAAYPAMLDTELRELADSIKQNGLIEPITRLGDEILDGRNRALACELAGVEPRYVEFTGDDPVRFVLAKNTTRRHLSYPERCLIAANLANLAHGGDRKKSSCSKSSLKPITVDEACAALSVSSGQVHAIRRVHNQGTSNAIKIVMDGRVGIQDAALAIVNSTEAEQNSWRGGADVRDALHRNYKRASRGPYNTSKAASEPPRRQRISALAMPAQPRLRVIPYEEGGPPPPEIANEQVPGAPEGWTRHLDHIAKHGRVQIFSPAEKLLHVDEGWFMELNIRLKWIAEQEMRPLARIDDCFPQLPGRAARSRALLEKYLDTAIERLQTLRGS